ncbi:MAG: response regulator, partial [Clostridiales bacterium]|nr:response regulator [Clostridiales bacterium]
MNHKGTLLLVDDDENLTFSHALLFEREGYEVHTALTLAEARERLAAKDPDLILLDIIMPDGDGIEFSEEIKSQTSAFILFLTNKKGSEDIVRGYIAGGNDYITKPYDMDLLLQRIAAGLETRAKFMSRKVVGTAQTNIDTGKYAAVPLPQLVAPRNELIAKLDEAARRGFVFVCAPAGSGKTVSANLWAKYSGRKTVWIGLDTYDNSVSVFYRLFCAGLLSAQPYNEQMNAILNDPSFDAAPIERTISLLAAFLADENEYALALDDFHTITNNEILKSLPYILRRMPSSFVTLILSRTEPSEHFADFMQAEVITADSLAFGKSEIEEYFSLLGRKMSESDAQAISDYTGGWAIGVNALAQSAAPITDWRGHGGQVLGNYIEKHLWREWDENLRKFMLASAVLDEMPVPLCAQITGRDDTGEVLEQLRMQNAFVSRIDGGVYRYHHLFLDFLRTQPEYAKANKKKALTAAAIYYTSIGDDVFSQRYAYESGDIKTILKILTKGVFNEDYTLEEFLGVARDFYVAPSMENLCAKCPVLYSIRAYVAFLIGDAALCIDSVDKLKRNIPMIIIKYPQFAELAFACSALDFRVSFLELAKKANKLPPFFFHKEVIKMGFLTLQMP